MSSYEEILRITSELVRRRVERGRDREIQPTDRIQEDLGLDSLAVMEFASDVENQFNVSIPAELYDRIHTVADVARAVADLQKRSGRS
jgi:acyl carrier protein